MARRASGRSYIGVDMGAAKVAPAPERLSPLHVLAVMIIAAVALAVFGFAWWVVYISAPLRWIGVGMAIMGLFWLCHDSNRATALLMAQRIGRNARGLRWEVLRGGGRCLGAAGMAETDSGTGRRTKSIGGCAWFGLTR